MNDVVAKPATQVRVADQVELRVRGTTRSFEVLEVIDRRVGAPIAVRCYSERTRPGAPSEGDRGAPAPVASRERGSGRPTKRDRRELDRLRGRR